MMTYRPPLELRRSNHALMTALSVLLFAAIVVAESLAFAWSTATMGAF